MNSPEVATICLATICLAGCATNRNVPPLPPTAPPIPRLTAMRANGGGDEAFVNNAPAPELIVVNWGENPSITGRNTFTWLLPEETRYVRVQRWVDGVAEPDYVHDREVYGPALFIKPGLEASVVMKATSIMEEVR
jgi:nitrous oxide reductase accessory protein NosL